MRGWLVEAPGEISWRDDLPQPSANEGLIGIDVLAAAVNFADSLVVGGTYQTIPPYPFTPGLEVLGRVTSPSAGGFEEGQLVVGLTTAGGGSWAEYALCDPRQVVAVPDSIDPRDALAVHTNAQTAWFALHRRARVAPGEHVLVLAAAGGVGSMAVQLARAHGCVVHALTSASKVDEARRLGAHTTWSREDPDWSERLRESLVADGAGVDAVIDAVGADTGERAARLLRFEGRHVIVGFTGGGPPTVRANHVLVKNTEVTGVHWWRYPLERPDLVEQAATEIFTLLASGAIDPAISAVEPLDRAWSTAQKVASGRTTGKVLIAD